jgi:5-methylcytosine-specific restriction endonuclease McrA
MMHLNVLTDDALLARLEALSDQERSDVADLVEHLAEVDRRELAIDRGYPTLFEYCCRKLRYSEAAAFLRIRAARASRKFPRVLADLRSGALHLDAVMRLYPHLNVENSDRLLDDAAGATKREVQALVARFDSTAQAPERDVIRFLPPPVPAPPPVDSRNDSIEVLPPPSRIRMAFTADDEFLGMVERLKNMRRHKFPQGRLEDLLKEAVGVALEQFDPMRTTRKRKPGSEIKRGARRRRIPIPIKREVWKRDGGMCAYLAEDGTRCGSRSFIEYDHIVPWALGGASDQASNVRVLCRAHNLRAARRRFGARVPRASNFV